MSWSAAAPTVDGMENTGDIYVNPVTMERAVVLVSGADSGSEFVRAELWAPPGARVAAPHLHPRQAERFEVLQGRLGVRRGAVTTTVGPLAQEWDDQIRFASPARWVQRVMVAGPSP